MEDTFEEQILELERRIEADPDLLATYFQFGRYLLMGSSRPGTLPANLQGLWNQDRQPAWNSGYTTNINLQMNYWPAQSTNLGETHYALFDFIERRTRILGE